MTKLKALREMTGISYLACSEALKTAEGDLEKAKRILREQGNQIAKKKASRKTHEGIVGAYVHNEGRIGVLVEALCETDFAARTDVFKGFVQQIAMHIAAMEPKFILRSDIPIEQIEAEKNIFLKQANKDTIPDAVLPRFLTGKLEQYYKEVSLMDQPYFKDGSITVADFTNQCIARIKENIVIRRFERFEVMNE